MLEYDEKTYNEINSPYKSSYNTGIMLGSLSIKIYMLKILTKKYTDEQILRAELNEDDSTILIKKWNKTELADLLDFYHKYETLNEDQLSNRYIAESEHLPWSGF